MTLSERTLAVLDFRKRLPMWRRIVAEHAEQMGCSGAKSEYHEVHIYCRPSNAAERARLKATFEGLGLWVSRFRFTHECRDGQFAEIPLGRAREEFMLGTHFLLPSQLATIFVDELVAIMRGLKADVLRVRVERPLGQSTARFGSEARAAWWEAHIGVAAPKQRVFLAVQDLGVRDLSVKVDFVSGEDALTDTYVNIEANGASGKSFASRCDAVSQRIIERLCLRPRVGLEEVLFDRVLDVSLALREPA